MIKHQEIKQRFGIIGNSNKLDRAINTAIQIAPTDISVLITGESGVGKESIPNTINLLLSTVGQFLKAPLIANFLATKKVLLQERVITDKVILKSQMVAQYS